MRFALLFPVALLCAFTSQERNYEEYEVTKFKVRGGGSRWTVDMTLRHQFPKGALISIEARQRRHKFNWQSRGFFFGIDSFNSDSTPVNCETGNRTMRTKNLTVSTPGMYEFNFWFDPNVQSRGRQLRQKMGDRDYFRYDLLPLSRTIGDADKMLNALQQDTSKCAKMISRAKKLLDRIERESDDKDWKEKSEGIFKELGEMKSEADEEKNNSLHNAAYQVISELLEELVIVGSMIKQLQAEAGGADGSFNSDGGDDEPDTTHPEEGGNTPIVGGADGKKLSVKKIKEHLTIADTARLREFYSWITLLHQEGLERLWSTYQLAKKSEEGQDAYRAARNAIRSTNSELEKSFNYIHSKKEWKKSLEPWTFYKVEDEEQRYEDFFARVLPFTKILTEDAKSLGAVPAQVKEARADIMNHLSTARVKVMGKF